VNTPRGSLRPASSSQGYHFDSSLSASRSITLVGEIGSAAEAWPATRQNASVAQTAATPATQCPRAAFEQLTIPATSTKRIDSPLTSITTSLLYESGDHHRPCDRARRLATMIVRSEVGCNYSSSSRSPAVDQCSGPNLAA